MPAYSLDFRRRHCESTYPFEGTLHDPVADIRARQAPYFLSVLPAAQPTATPILTLPDQPQAGELEVPILVSHRKTDLLSPPLSNRLPLLGSYTWTVNLPAGTNITLQVRDGTGAVNYGSPVVIQPGTSDSCVDQAGASSAAAVGGGAATTGASSAASTTGSAASSLVTSSGSVTLAKFVY